MSFLPRSMSSRPLLRLQPTNPPPLPRRTIRTSTIRSQPHAPHSASRHHGPGASTLGSSASSSSSSSGPAKKPSPHLVWYREIVPAMVPILLLSSTIFLSLTLLRTHLSHNLSLSESSERIAELEAQLEKMRRDQKRIRERERKERERILPLVVERVLQRVGAMSEEVEDEDVKAEKEKARLLV